MSTSCSRQRRRSPLSQEYDFEGCGDRREEEDGYLADDEKSRYGKPKHYTRPKSHDAHHNTPRPKFPVYDRLELRKQLAYHSVQRRLESTYGSLLSNGSTHQNYIM